MLDKFFVLLLFSYCPSGESPEGHGSAVDVGTMIIGYTQAIAIPTYCPYAIYVLILQRLLGGYQPNAEPLLRRIKSDALFGTSYEA